MEFSNINNNKCSKCGTNYDEMNIKFICDVAPDSMTKMFFVRLQSSQYVKFIITCRETNCNRTISFAERSSDEKLFQFCVKKITENFESFISKKDFDEFSNIQIDITNYWNGCGNIQINKNLIEIGNTQFKLPPYEKMSINNNRIYLDDQLWHPKLEETLGNNNIDELKKYASFLIFNMCVNQTNEMNLTHRIEPFISIPFCEIHIIPMKFKNLFIQNPLCCQTGGERA